MLIARGAQMMNGEGSYPFAPGNNDESTLQPPCIFTLCRDIWLLPVTVENITLHNNQQQGCIEIAFFAENGINPGRTDFNKLRFWLGDEDEYTRNQLYLWLSEYLADAEFVTEGDSVRLPDFALEQVGFSKQDALLPWPGNVYSGYRILQEYLCFKDAFFFFNVQGIHSLPVTDKDVNRFTLRLHFSRPLPLDTRIRKTSLRLYCAPAINLFSCESEPIAIVDSREEYPLRRVICIASVMTFFLLRVLKAPGGQKTNTGKRGSQSLHAGILRLKVFSTRSSLPVTGKPFITGSERNRRFFTPGLIIRSLLFLLITLRQPHGIRRRLFRCR